MSTETHNGQAEHDTSEHDAGTSDTPAPRDRWANIVRDAEEERVVAMAERDQINAQIKALQKKKAGVNREIERCDSVIEWSTKTLTPRGVRKAAQPAPKKR